MTARRMTLLAMLAGTVMIALPVILVCCSLLLIAWAEYNRYRFGGKERRAPREDSSREDIAHALVASDALAAQLMNAKAVTLHMDDNARPVGMTRPPLL